MKLFRKILALLQAPASESASPAPYTDEEFLSVVMEQARKRIRDEQATQQAPATPPTGPDQLSAAA
jgi:hypothetical protein